MSKESQQGPAGAQNDGSAGDANDTGDTSASDASAAQESGLAYWQQVGAAAFPRRTAELVRWMSEQDNTWLATILQRRIARQADQPLDADAVVNEVFLDLLDRLAIGIAVVTADLAVYFSNRQFQELAAADSALTITDERLVLRNERLRTEFAQVTNDIVWRQGEHRDGRAIRVNPPLRTAGSDRGPLFLYLTAGITGQENQETNGPLICVFATRVEAPQSIDPSDVARWFELTAAEAELACCFAYGESLQAYSRRRQLSLNTVRNQFAALKGKLNATSQADVVRRVLLGNPLVAFSKHLRE